MVAMKDIQQTADRIAREFHPEKIILFGSYAGNTPTPDSDVDLLVILPFEGKNFTKSVEMLSKVNPPFAADLLARCPEDTRRRYELGDPLIRAALDEGVTLYERAR